MRREDDRVDRGIKKRRECMKDTGWIVMSSLVTRSG